MRRLDSDIQSSQQRVEGGQALRTSVSADPPRRASSSKEDDGITHQLDVVLERRELLIGELGVARVELQP